jgi:hypothetical protein
MAYAKVGWLWSVPAFLYCVYNRLMFTNLTFFEPATYRLLMNQRLIWSGILSQVLSLFSL